MGEKGEVRMEGGERNRDKEDARMIWRNVRDRKREREIEI